MRIMPPFEEKIRESIRDELAKKPTISMCALKEQLEKEYDRTFHHTYIRRLVDKVQRQSLITADRTQIEQRVNFTRENYRMMRDRMLKIIYWSPPEVIDDIRD